MTEPHPTPGISKNEFVQRLQSALGKSQRTPVQPYQKLQESLDELVKRARELQEHLQHIRSKLLDALSDLAPKRGWKFFRTRNTEEAIDYIVALCKQKDVESVVRSDEEVLQSLPVDQPLLLAGARVTVIAKSSGFSQQDWRKTAANAGLGITGADFAIAETATVVAIPRKGLSRLVSLVPPIHLAIVRPQDVVERLEDVFLLRRLAYKNGGDVPNYMNFITGPSRTGDIEQTIIVGVHGPKEVHMLLLG